MSRSPVRLLGDILDEVEGLRQTDARSFLPERMLTEIRNALTPEGANNTGGALGPVDLDSLVGETIEHVYDGDLRRGEILILCTSGAFAVLDSSDDDSYISCLSGRGGVDQYLKPRELESIGLITREQRMQAERKAEIETAERLFKRATEAARAAGETLARLKAVDAAEAPIESQAAPAIQHLPSDDTEGGAA